MKRFKSVEKYILERLEQKSLLFTLIDPLDYKNLSHATKVAKACSESGADAVLIGGSIGVQGDILDNVAKEASENSDVPVILFPGNIGTVTKYADAIYYMSLLNSRDPYWISGAQALATPVIKAAGIETLPVGYVVVEPGGTVGFVGDAKRIPREKPELAVAYALAAQYMGFRFVLTDCGSNPKDGHIPLEMVHAVSSAIDVPYIVAGGIRTPEQAKNVVAAGADIIQVGTALENETDVQKLVSSFSKSMAKIK